MLGKSTIRFLDARDHVTNTHTHIYIIYIPRIHSFLGASMSANEKELVDICLRRKLTCLRKASFEAFGSAVPAVETQTILIPLQIEQKITSTS